MKQRFTNNKQRGFALRLLGALLLSCLLAGQLNAGTVKGVIKDSRWESFLPGARVWVGDTGLSGVTDRKGYYEINNVPDGNHRLLATYSGYTSDTAQVTVSGVVKVEQDFDLKVDSAVYELETFVMESIPLGNTRALNKQKSLDAFANVISADALGNLPDSTLGQALSRVPGINVVDDNKVSIRGSEARLNSITLDGDKLNTPNGGTERATDRSLDLSNIPAELIGGIEVYKVLLPSMDADSFGGTVNVTTKSAFDFPDRIASITTDYRFFDYEPENAPLSTGGYSLALNYGEKITDNFGVFLTGSFINEKYWEERTSIRYFSPTDSRVRDIDAITDDGVRELDRRVQHKDKDKLSLTGTFDFKLGDDSSFYIKLYNMDNEETANYWRLRMKDLRDWDDTSNSTIQSGTEGRVRKRRERLPTDNSTQRITIGGKTAVNDWNINYSMLYSTSENNLQRLRTNFQTINRGSTDTHEEQRYRDKNVWTTDRTDPLYPTVKMTISDEDSPFFGQNSYLVNDHLELTQVRDWIFDRNTDYTVARIDVDRDLAWDRPSKIKFGTKYSKTERSDRSTLVDVRELSVGEDGNYSQPNDFKIDSFEPVNTHNGTQDTLGTYADIDDVFAHVASNPDLYGDRFNNAGDERLNAGENNFDLDETITAAYGMFTQDYGDLRMIYGLRYEDTDFTALWAWPAAPPEARVSTRGYDNFFPSVIATYRKGENHVFRAGWTNTISRPNLNDLIPRSSDYIIDDEEPDQPGTKRIGNPDLGAQESMNFDLSYEYFYKPAGNVGVQVFVKDIEDFIFVHSYGEQRPYEIIDPDDADFGTTQEGFFAIEQSRNGASQKIKGVEFSWQQQLNFLPAPFNAMGINANLTLLDGESKFLEEIDVDGVDTIVTVTQDYILSQPDAMYNLQLYWVKGRVTLRTAYNYRDTFFRSATTRGTTTPTQRLNGVITEWSASAAYDFNETWRLDFQLRNIGEDFRSEEYENRIAKPRSFTFKGMTGNIGLRARF